MPQQFFCLAVSEVSHRRRIVIFAHKLQSNGTMSVPTVERRLRQPKKIHCVGFGLKLSYAEFRQAFNPHLSV